MFGVNWYWEAGQESVQANQLNKGCMFNVRKIFRRHTGLMSYVCWIHVLYLVVCVKKSKTILIIIILSIYCVKVFQKISQDKQKNLYLLVVRVFLSYYRMKPNIPQLSYPKEIWPAQNEMCIVCRVMKVY